MKLDACAAAFMALGAAATDLASLQKQLPPCSVACLAQSVQDHGCSIADFACSCAHLDPIMKTIGPCLVKAGCTLDNMTGKQGRVDGLRTSADDEANATSAPNNSKASSGAAAIVASLALHFCLSVLVAMTIVAAML
ncbi:hypothetical protein HIM_03774 [Hirsutella minnesotensis 3608]|uniref:CFEM domain-containing protein n=1 Tax=Hirsutella minnesotensis 3608 TaxID=1043627 RepID=A0A0F8A2A7_9HYPO|nr:hypothetical protein HIM_03774 [Hirsutella minnesotensis 3608]